MGYERRSQNGTDSESGVNSYQASGWEPSGTIRTHQHAV